VQDYFAKTLALDLAKVEPVLQKSGLKFYGDLRLPVGTYSLRVMVRNGATGAAGLRVVALEVPAFARATPVLLTPFFPEPAGKWLIVRKSNEAPKDVPYPFLAQRQPYVPAALPVLRAGEPAAMALVGYHLQPGELKVDGRILTADGREAGQGQVKLVERQSGSAAEPDRLSATFRPPALSPGEYVLLVTLTDAAGAAETSTASFVVAKGVGG